MLRESAYLAISTYGTVSVFGGIASILLPIETKGREMKVGPTNIVLLFLLYSTSPYVWST